VPGTALRILCEVMVTLNLECVIRPRTKASAADIENIF
jgi:hypothetical protein